MQHLGRWPLTWLVVALTLRFDQGGGLVDGRLRFVVPYWPNRLPRGHVGSADCRVVDVSPSAGVALARSGDPVDVRSPWRWRLRLSRFCSAHYTSVASVRPRIRMGGNLRPCWKGFPCKPLVGDEKPVVPHTCPHAPGSAIALHCGAVATRKKKTNTKSNHEIFCVCVFTAMWSVQVRSH